MALLFLAASDVFAKGNIPVAPVPAWVQPIALEINTRVRPAEVSYGYHSLLRDYHTCPVRPYSPTWAIKCFQKKGYNRLPK